jgi:hypothetical protein
MSQFPLTSQELSARVERAVAHYWSARTRQQSTQLGTGVTDTGTRGEVTGGQHLNEFCTLFCEIIKEAGFSGLEVRFKTGVEVPGYYRPTKKWDIVVVRDNRIFAAIEMKSQVGPSFGNNTNNRTEEAVGSAVDLWRAFETGVLGAHPPWVGYFFLLEQTRGSTDPVRIAPTPFPVDPIFPGTSYAGRYRVMCQRLVLDRRYNSACLLYSPRGVDGKYEEASPDLAFEQFVRSLFGHLVGAV